MPLTLADLRGENTLSMVGMVARLPRRLDREADLGGELADTYSKEALSGNYENALAVTERYAVRYLQTTLSASEGDLTGDEDADVCDHCGVPTTPGQERECDECTDRILGNV